MYISHLSLSLSRWAAMAGPFPRMSTTTTTTTIIPGTWKQSVSHFRNLRRVKWRRHKSDWLAAVRGRKFERLSSQEGKSRPPSKQFRGEWPLEVLRVTNCSGIASYSPERRRKNRRVKVERARCRWLWGRGRGPNDWIKVWREPGREIQFETSGKCEAEIALKLARNCEFEERDQSQLWTRSELLRSVNQKQWNESPEQLQRKRKLDTTQFLHLKMALKIYLFCILLSLWWKITSIHINLFSCREQFRYDLWKKKFLLKIRKSSKFFISNNIILVFYEMIKNVSIN